jgi:hypothetical protein
MPRRLRTMPPARNSTDSTSKIHDTPAGVDRCANEGNSRHRAERFDESRSRRAAGISFMRLIPTMPSSTVRADDGTVLHLDIVRPDAADLQQQRAADA